MTTLELFILRTLLTLATLFMLGVLLETIDRPWYSRYSFMALILTLILLLFASFNGVEHYAHATIYFMIAFTLSTAVTFSIILRTITDPRRLARLRRGMIQYGIVTSLTLGLVWVGGSCGGKKPDLKKPAATPRNAGPPVSQTVTVGDTTKRAIDNFTKLTNP